MKVRCSFCKTYCDKDSPDLWRSGIQTFCSFEHYVKYRNKIKSTPRKRPNMESDLRETVIAADGNRCRNCGVTYGLRVHHVRYRSEGGKDAEENLLTLCDQCHILVHSDKNVYQSLCLQLIGMREEGNISVTISDLLGATDVG